MSYWDQPTTYCLGSLILPEVASVTEEWYRSRLIHYLIPRECNHGDLEAFYQPKQIFQGSPHAG